MRMPLYDYTCARHGAFRAWRPMSESDLAAGCPECGGPSLRQIAMPYLQQVSRNVRIAHERNERSADEPKVMRREELLARHGKVGRHDADHQHAPHRRTMLGHAH
jgi:putative FmdB family regulatory protein